MNKEMLEKYCPELISVMNIDVMRQHVKENPPKFPIHTEQGFKEIREDKIRLNSK